VVDAGADSSTGSTVPSAGLNQPLSAAARPQNEDARLTGFLDQAIAGDARAFEVVYRAVHPGLLRYLSALVGPEAEDIASEAWGQVVRDLRKFRGTIDGFRGWTATIARNRALDHLRSQARHPVSSTPVEELTERAGPAVTFDEAMAAISTEAALKLIASLPREQAEAVLLRVVVGLDAKGAGKVLGKRAGAVRTAAYRGLNTLAARLAEARQEFGSPPPGPGQ